MFKSITLRMTITYLLLMVAVMLVTGLILLNMLENYYLTSEENNLMRTGKLASELISSYLRESPDLVFLSNLAENFSRQIHARVLIISPQKQVLGDSVRIGGLMGVKLDRPEVDEALQGNKGRSIQYSRISERWVLQVAVPVKENGRPLGVVFLSTSLKDVYNTLSAIRRFLILSTLVAMIFAGSLVVMFAHHMTGPIKELTNAAQRMAEGELDQKIPVNSRDEIGRLAQQFNIMASRVKEMNQRLTRFVADVSHELRTPLASIILCLQSLEDYDMKPEEQREFLQDINQEAQRLTYLVEDLLELTRRQEVADKREIVAVKELLEEVLEATKPRLERKDLELFTEIPEELPNLYISPEGLKRVLYNLLDNAIKYTSPGGWLKVIAAEEEGKVRITVQDTGCGMPEESLPHIFERFYRVDKARSRLMGGTGLGLSICKEIVEFYGGEIGVESRLEEGSSFFFTIPVDPALQQKEEI
ncbi:MAG: ATP-binding protein [Dethiobacteria bacterium]|jgi:two-component system OmpR family sensor kinase